jgi:hypothetical protein
MGMHIGIIFFCINLVLLDIHSPARKSFCVPSEKSVWFSDTLCMDRFFHLIVTGEIEASQKCILVDQSGDRTSSGLYGSCFNN